MELDVIIRGDAGARRHRHIDRTGWAAASGWPVDGLEELPRLAPSLRIRRALSSSTSTRMATFSSASEKKRRSRSRARTQRCAIWTATSTLALSRGLRAASA